MARMFEHGDPVSPSGCVVMDATGRRGEIVKRPPRLHCTWCGGHVTAPRRRTWCSQECVEAYQGTQPNYYRWRVQARDSIKADECCRTVCASCGDTGYNHQVDHIVPIIEGGHPFDLANLRMLCLPCHKAETAALATRRADARKFARGEGVQVGLFGSGPAGQLQLSSESPQSTGEPLEEKTPGEVVPKRSPPV